MSHEGIQPSELEHFDAKTDQLSVEINELISKRDECRGERELIPDFRRYSERIEALTAQRNAIVVERAAYIKSHRIFDRELEQFDLLDQWFANETSKRQTLANAGRISRSDPDLKSLWRQRVEVDRLRDRYIRDRDHLIATGPTEGIVMPGSIVTVRDAYDDLYKFVLTARPSDTEFPVESYSSELGAAIIRKHIGDRVLKRRHLYTEIVDIEPGFRLVRR